LFSRYYERKPISLKYKTFIYDHKITNFISEKRWIIQTIIKDHPYGHDLLIDKIIANYQDEIFVHIYFVYKDGFGKYYDIYITYRFYYDHKKGKIRRFHPYNIINVLSIKEIKKKILLSN
jgi:hypothetical protein